MFLLNLILRDILRKHVQPENVPLEPPAPALREEGQEEPRQDHHQSLDPPPLPLIHHLANTGHLPAPHRYPTTPYTHPQGLKI